MLNHTPNVCIDYDIVEGNIQRALDRIRPYGLKHRPHIKAHKSVELAKLQIAKGCSGITCAKLGEAEVMANAGINDVLLAYPLIGEEKLDGIDVKGVEVYSGDIYDLKTEERIRRRARVERDEILECARTLEKLGMHPEILSGGSSFSVLFPEELEGITEIRAGNYIFNDNALFSIGMVPREYCAMTVKSMVVAKAESDIAIIDAGAKTLSSDLVHLHEGYGAVVGHPEAEITKLNEEHGFVHMSGLEVGDIIEIIPNHACVIPNLFDQLPAYRKGEFDHWIKIDARGMNY